jgi:tRNA threonylcarbamoyl adenosine modification protein YeaZ
MLVLGLDTSTTTGGVAIVSEQGLIANYQLDVTVTHSARLFPAIDAILRNAQLTLKEINGIAVTIGPGSFTGLRIGLAAAKGLSYLNKIPIVGVPTLDALVYPFTQPYTRLLICPILDALRGEVYAALYQVCDRKWAKLLEDTAIPIPELLDKISEPCLFTGNGITKHKAEIESVLQSRALFTPLNLRVVLPSSVAELGLQKLLAGVQDDPLKLEPRYIRRPEAEVVWEKKYRKK